MKKAAMITVIALLAAAFVYPAFAHGPRWGAMGGGPGKRGMDQGWGPGACWRGGTGYSALSEEQRIQLQELRQRFLDETAGLRSKLWAKRGELRALLSASNPDETRLKELQAQINELRAQLSQKRLEYNLQAKKIAPGAAFGRGPGFGMGYGHWMRGFGPGACLP